MSNSSLVSYTKLSPNHSGKRTHSIDRITPHCVVGQLSCESICDCFPAGRNASCNYGIGTDGRISLCVDEGNRSWCSSSSANDQRAVTIECASDKTAPYAFNNAVYTSLINLCADICKRNGKNRLLWFGDKDKTLNYSPASNEVVLTVHRWFANKSCPGDWMYNRMGDLAEKVNAILGASANPPAASNFQATSLKDMKEADIIKKVGSLFTADQKSSGILASVSFAQFILESGYGKSELAQAANNCFGMKCSLSGNTWGGSAWDGKSKYTKKTQEFENGQYVTVTADFRKYPSVDKSIADHSAYLLGAMNGSKKRYEGLKGCLDYKKAIQIIKDGGYATSPDYVTKICNIIEKWNLTDYDIENATTPTTPADNSNYPAVPFTVKVIIDDLNYRSEPSMNGKVNGQTGKGIFTITMVSNGWGKLKSGAGWIWLGNPSYCTIQGSTTPATPSFNPYMVRVNIPDLNIRSGAGTNYKSNGYTGKGVFTIVAESDGQGASKWGKLKSGAGWISLDFVTKV